MARQEKNEDAHRDSAASTAIELLEEEFSRVHMQTLRYYISIARLHEQRVIHMARDTASLTENERDTHEEFEIELENLHDLLINEHLKTVHVLQTARKSIEQYVVEWPGAQEATNRWWQAREDKASAIRADLQLVMPGLWIGSSVTVKPQFDELLMDKRIRHVVYCKSSKPDNDEDFLHGSERAKDPGVDNTAAQFPVIQQHESLQSQQHHHTITLFELGQMEFLVRRRENALPTGSTTAAMDKICRYLHDLVQNTKETQYKLLDACQIEGDEPQFVSEFDGLLLYCDAGVSTSIAVCMALLMFELRLPYDTALHMIHCARRYVGPSESLQHQLKAYHSFLQSANQYK